jgi:hypothetical protein
MIRRIGCIKLPVNRLHMELTNMCNFDCEFCPDSRMKRPKGLMEAETARAILDEVAETGIAKSVHFHVMGEPTLHPQLADIVSYATSRGIETCLTTNGSRFDEMTLEALLTAGIDRIIISLQTPDEKTFAFRGSKGLTFDEYKDRILQVSRRFLSKGSKTELSINFLSSPLRRLIIPVFPEVSIADTSSDLKRHLECWADLIISGSKVENRRPDIMKQIKKIHSFRENMIRLTDRLVFNTRIMGDWSVHFDRKNVNAIFGFCPGIQDNLGILWNGDYTFCCTDFDGMTSAGNFNGLPIRDYLSSKEVQNTVAGFNGFRVVHKYCKQCIGDRNLLNTMVRQMGSIFYFKLMKRKLSS